MERAYELCAARFSCSLTIGLETGTHYLLRSKMYRYLPIMIDRNSHNIALTIRPLLCSDLTVGNTFYSCANSLGT